ESPNLASLSAFRSSPARLAPPGGLLPFAMPSRAACLPSRVGRRHGESIEETSASNAGSLVGVATYKDRRESFDELQPVRSSPSRSALARRSTPSRRSTAALGNRRGPRCGLGVIQGQLGGARFLVLFDGDPRGPSGTDPCCPGRNRIDRERIVGVLGDLER